MLLAQADKLPPFICRLLARKRVMVEGVSSWQPMSHSDISVSSGLSRSTVSYISRKTSWATVPLATADKFATACGVDLLRPYKNLRQLAHSVRLRHIRSGNAHQRRFFARLFKSKQG